MRPPAKWTPIPHDKTKSLTCAEWFISSQKIINNGQWALHVYQNSIYRFLFKKSKILNGSVKIFKSKRKTWRRAHHQVGDTLSVLRKEQEDINEKKQKLYIL